MPDLEVVALIVAKPGSEDVVRGALSDLVAPTRGEPGNRRYELSESAVAPGSFVTIESRTDQAAADAHLQTPHIAVALGLVREHLAAAPAIHPLIPVAAV